MFKNICRKVFLGICFNKKGNIHISEVVKFQFHVYENSFILS